MLKSLKKLEFDIQKTKKFVNKVFQKQQILSDLAVLSGGFVVIVSVLVVTREIVGPFQNVPLVSSIFVFFQFFYTTMLSCIVSLQVSILSMCLGAAFTRPDPKSAKKSVNSSSFLRFWDLRL